MMDPSKWYCGAPKGPPFSSSKTIPPEIASGLDKLAKAKARKEEGFASVFKDAAASLKAWETRRRNAAAAAKQKPAEDKPKKLKTRVDVVKGNEAKVMALQMYMAGFFNRLKNKDEKKYVSARVEQMTSGQARPKGMSARFGIPKDRVRALEIVTYHVFKAGREKLHV